MRYKKYITKYGSINFRQYGYPDVSYVSMLEDLTKDQLFSHVNSYSVKGNLKKARIRVAKYLYRLMWEVIVEEAMKGNIVELPYEGKVFIGVVSQLSRKHTNFNTNGAVYNIKLQLDKDHGYKLRMPYRKRKELKELLDEGKHFVTY